MTKSFTQDFSRFSSDTRAAEASKIAEEPALMDMIEKTVREAAAAFPDQLGNLFVMPVPGWGAPLFATDSVMQQLAVTAARKEVLDDHGFQSKKKAKIEKMEAELKKMEAESGMTQKKLDDRVDEMKSEIEQFTRTAIDELMRPDKATDREKQTMQTDPERVRDALEHMIREATTEREITAKANGTHALAYKISGVPVTLLALVSSDHFRVKYPDGYTSEMAGAATVDRMLGTLIFKNDPEAAKAAEIFAALRHRQRYPDQKTDYAFYRHEAIASNLTLKAEAQSNALNALDQAMAEADKRGAGITGLSLKELAEVVRNTATPPRAATQNKIQPAPRA